MSILTAPFRFLCSWWRSFRLTLLGHDAMAPEATVTHRREVCDGCPQRNTVLNMCGVCNCFLSVKQLFQVETCPLGYWRH